MDQRYALIVTPYTEFSDILCECLQRDIGIEVKIASTALTAQHLILRIPKLNYIFLDLELGTEMVLILGGLFREQFPEHQLIIISRQDPPAELETLQPWKLLQKPFRPKELFTLLGHHEAGMYENEDYIDIKLKSTESGVETLWGDIKALSAILKSSAVNSLNVQEAILISNENILAHSGNFPPDAVEEFSDIIRSTQSGQIESEVIKPIRLKSTNTNHLLLITLLVSGIKLALAFDSDTPFNQIRAETRQIALVLKDPRHSLPQAPALPEKIGSTGQTYPTPTAISDINTTDLAPTNTPRQRKNPATQRKLWKVENRPASISTYINQDNKQNNFDLPQVKLKPPATSRLSPEKQDKRIRSIREPGISSPSGQSTAKVHARGQTTTSVPMVSSEKIDHVMYSLSSDEPDFHGLYYACLLVPRFKSDRLVGDLASLLMSALPSMFLTFGWRLENVNVNDSYLQWLTNIPPTVAPSKHIKTIRVQTSTLIFRNFSFLTRNSSVRDFWAPGYLLGSGRQLLPSGEIEEFIHLNRSQYYGEIATKEIVGESSRAGRRSGGRQGISD
jgi:REP element-mobilizing transposase RayT